MPPLPVPPEDGPAPTEDGVPEIWKPGDVILDRYEVREVFTGGGMGLVYRVWHRGWNLDLAVKCPRPEHFRDEHDKENFEREAETWVKLGQHPHAVACYYVRRLGGIPRVFAEYVGGDSLAEWIRTRKLYAGGPDKALERVLDVAIQFAWGLHHAHEQGLVHRDVKPGNVLLTAEGVAKVTDFGMARARGAAAAALMEGTDSALVSAGGLTPAFCSPEQVRGRRLTRKTDIWSWGVSVLEMFTGAATWSAGYLAGEALRSYLRTGPEDEQLPPMPRGVADLLRRCFRRDPRARPGDMLAIAAELQEIYQQTTGRPYPRAVPVPAEALADNLNNQAVSLLDLNKQPEAEQLWQQALAADPNHPESVYNLGLCRLRAGRKAEPLLQKLREICALHPGDWLPLYLLAQVQLDQGDWAAAIDSLGKITGAGASLDEVRAALALAQARQAFPGRRVRSLEGHTSWVSSVSLSTDGRYALSGGADQTLRLWEVATGQCLRIFEGHADWVTAVALSADGRHAVSGSADRTLRLWDLATGRCLRVFKGHAKGVLAVALRADGRLALAGDAEGSLRLWEVATGACLQTFHGHADPVLTVAFLGDGRFVSGSSDATIRLWDISSGQCFRKLEGHGGKVFAVSVGVGGKYILSGSADRTIRLWETATGRCLRSLEGHSDAVLTVVLSPDGRYALSGSRDRTVRRWRLNEGRCLETLTGHTGAVNSVCLGVGGRYAVSASGDGTLALWALPRDVEAPYMVSRVLPSEMALAAQAAYEGALQRAWQALAGGDAPAAAHCLREARAQPGYGRRPEVMSCWAGLYVRLRRKGLNGGWEGPSLEGHLDVVTAACLSRDGRHALSASADRTLRLWDTATGQCLRTFERHRDWATAACLTPDGRHALSASADGTLKLWEPASGRCLRTYSGHASIVTSACLSADGRYALSGSADRTVRLWELATGRCLRVLEGHTGPVFTVALSLDGRHALSGSAQFLTQGRDEKIFTSGQLKMWDLAAGRCLPTFEWHTEAVTAVCLSPDGRQVLTGGGQAVIQYATGRFLQSGQLQLWEAATGRPLCTFPGHADVVTVACLTLDGRYVLSGSADRTLRLWELATGRCLRTFAGHADAVTAAALSADGRYALSGSADRTLRLWVLDWELEENRPADWDEGARPYLEAFLAQRTPFACHAAEERKRGARGADPPLPRRRPSPARGEDQTRRRRPRWAEEDFEELIYTLGCAGYGWLRPAGVRRQLERMTFLPARSVRDG